MSKFSEQQIIGALKQVESGAKVATVVRRLGVTEQTFYCWRAKYVGMTAAPSRS